MRQTIEMFEVIAQSQPQDYQSLEILKEAYSKLGREKEVIATSKRIAQAYVQMGQLSSAILEYETVLQRHPDDPDVQAALKQIENKANNFAGRSHAGGNRRRPDAGPQTDGAGESRRANRVAAEVDDGRKAMHKIFVESKVITAGDFDLCWPTPDLTAAAKRRHRTVHPGAGRQRHPAGGQIAQAAVRQIARWPICRWNDTTWTWTWRAAFPAAICRRWCVLPFDRMSKSILVATANPFNQQAAKELAEATTQPAAVVSGAARRN